MKYTIHGFSQEKAIKFKKIVVDKKGKEKEIKVDCTDLLILRWFVDFYPNMMKVEIGGIQYAWVKYSAILKDLPLLDIKKQALSDRLNKLCEFKILKHKTIKDQGTFSYYGFDEMYSSLIDTESSQIHNGEYSTTQGVCSQIHNGEYSTTQQIDSSIKEPSFNNLSSKDYIIDENFEKLWKMLKSHPNDRKSKVSKKRKKELYEMGEERTKRAIELYLKVQNPEYYHKRDNFLNEIIDNFLDKQESDFEVKEKPQEPKRYGGTYL